MTFAFNNSFLMCLQHNELCSSFHIRRVVMSLFLWNMSMQLLWQEHCLGIISENLIYFKVFWILIYILYFFSTWRSKIALAHLGIGNICLYINHFVCFQSSKSLRCCNIDFLFSFGWTEKPAADWAWSFPTHRKKKKEKNSLTAIWYRSSSFLPSFLLAKHI